MTRFTTRHLSQDEIHLWCLHLETTDADSLKKYQHLLSADEIIRAGKFKRGRDNFIHTRIFMRQVLSQYTGTAAENLTFEKAINGKPFLSQSDIQFNLSHSQQFAVLAVGINCDLGVDVESTSDRRSILDIARHYFHSDEIEKLTSMTNPEEQKDYFFRLWTLKESFLKALGTGIATGLEKAKFQINSVTDIDVKFSSELKLKNPEKWQFFQYELLDASVKNWCSVAVSSRNTVHLNWM